MRYLAFILLISSNAFAALDMRPGLWAVEMIVKEDGKTLDMANEMKKAMAKMTPEQKKAMMDKVGQNAGLGKDGKMQICYSKEMIENPEALVKRPKPNCKTNVIKDSKDEVVTNFKCPDGTSGNSNWSVTNSKSYKGLLHMVTQQGEPSDINYTGEFISGDCGKIKPVL